MTVTRYASSIPHLQGPLKGVTNVSLGVAVFPMSSSTQDWAFLSASGVIPTLKKHRSPSPSAVTRIEWVNYRGERWRSSPISYSHTKPFAFSLGDSSSVVSFLTPLTRKDSRKSSGRESNPTRVTEPKFLFPVCQHD